MRLPTRALRAVVLVAAVCLLALGLHQSNLSAQRARAATRTSLAASATTVAEGDTLTLTAVVSSSVDGRLNGEVQFFDLNRRLGRSALVSADGRMQALFEVDRLAAGTHPLTARYQGNDDYSGSASPIVMVVVGER